MHIFAALAQFGPPGSNPYLSNVSLQTNQLFYSVEQLRDLVNGELRGGQLQTLTRSTNASTSGPYDPSLSRPPATRTAFASERPRSGNSMRDALPQGLRTNSGSLAMFAAMRLVSSAQR